MSLDSTCYSASSLASPEFSIAEEPGNLSKDDDDDDDDVDDEIAAAELPKFSLSVSTESHPDTGVKAKGRLEGGAGLAAITRLVIG